MTAEPLRPDPAAMLENRTYDELAPGDSARLSHTVTPQDVELYAALAGEMPPGEGAVLPAQGAAGAPGETPLLGAGPGTPGPVGLAMLGAGLIATLIGTRLPGPGSRVLDNALHFLAPVRPGARLTASVTVRRKEPEGRVVVLDCLCRDAAGHRLIAGQARVAAPAAKLSRPRLELAELRLSRHQRVRRLLAEAAAAGPMVTAVAHPCTPAALGAVAEAARAGLITPILVGPPARIAAAAEGAGEDISAFRLVAAPHSHAAAEAAVALVRAGEAALLMKGSLHTDELLHAVLDKAAGLRTGRRLSHVYLMDVPGYPRPLLITDAAVNIDPDLEALRDIVQNAVDMAHVMGLAEPRVAILSAVETVTPALPSTLEAAALCKMAERGQITGALVDGPLAFDNAVSPAAAAEKGIVSAVAGQADILVAPDLEAGNMLAKQLTFLAGADAAGVVLGARVPIVLTSRADGERTRLASCAVAARLARAQAGQAAGAGGGLRGL